MDKAQWKMVPVNPTPMMISEGSCASSLPGPHYISESAALKCWQNMLAVSPQPPSASGERDLSQWEKARFGYFDDSGAFQELDMEGPPDFTPGRNARWVGGPYDMQLLRAALAPSPGIDAAERKPLSDDFRNGIRAAADCLMYTAANSDDGQWAGILNTYAADILELSPEDANEWKAIGTAYTEGFKAGQRAAPPAAQPSADDKNFPFYELRFIMRVLSHQGSAPKEDWQTAYGMARTVFERWAKERKAAGEWLAEAERLVDFYAESFSKPTDSGKCRQRLAALLDHLKART